METQTRQIALTYLAARAPDLDISRLNEVGEADLWEASAWIARSRLAEHGLTVQDPVKAIELDCEFGDDPTTAVGVLRECGIPAPPRGQLVRMRQAQPTASSLSNADEPGMETCEVCDGDGVVGGATCPHCQGSGHEPPARQRISGPTVGIKGNTHPPAPDVRDDPHTLSDPTTRESAVAALRECGIK